MLVPPGRTYLCLPPEDSAIEVNTWVQTKAVSLPLRVNGVTGLEAALVRMIVSLSMK